MRTETCINAVQHGKVAAITLSSLCPADEANQHTLCEHTRKGTQSQDICSAKMDTVIKLISITCFTAAGTGLILLNRSILLSMLSPYSPFPDQDLIIFFSSYS